MFRTDTEPRTTEFSPFSNLESCNESVDRQAAFSSKLIPKGVTRLTRIVNGHRKICGFWLIFRSDIFGEEKHKVLEVFWKMGNQEGKCLMRWDTQLVWMCGYLVWRLLDNPYCFSPVVQDEIYEANDISTTQLQWLPGQEIKEINLFDAYHKRVVSARYTKDNLIFIRKFQLVNHIPQGWRFFVFRAFPVPNMFFQCDVHGNPPFKLHRLKTCILTLQAAPYTWCNWDRQGLLKLLECFREFFHGTWSHLNSWGSHTPCNIIL